MDIFKITAIGICGGVITIVIKNYRSEFALPVSLMCGMVIVYIAVDYISKVNLAAVSLATQYGMDISYIKIIVKVMFIAYICQFACDLLKDSGLSSIAVKVELACKLVIFSYAFPVAEALLKLAVSMLEKG